MSDITIEELQEKVKRVEQDIQTLMSKGNTARGIDVLSEYKQYLEDEIRMLKNEQNIRRAR